MAKIPLWRSDEVLFAAEGRVTRLALLKEGNILFRYLMAGAPRPIMLRLYARAMEREGDVRPLRLPAAAIRWPALLAVFEPVLGTTPLARRLYLATLILDARPEGARRLYDFEGSGLGAVLLAIVRVGVTEALLMPSRLLLGRVVR